MEARGGAAALDAVGACAFELDVSEGGAAYRLEYVAATSGLVRVDVFAGGELVYREGIDADGAWAWPRGATEPQASAAGDALRNGAENHLFGLHRFAERGHKLRLVDDDVIEVTYVTGHVSFFTIDPMTGLIVSRRDVRAYHPELDDRAQEIESRYSDFTTVAGVVAPHHSVDVDLQTGRELAVQQVIRRELNPELPDDTFSRARGE